MLDLRRPRSSCNSFIKNNFPHCTEKGVLEDGLSSNGVPRPTAPGGISNQEKMNCGTQCQNSQSLSSGPLTQKQNGLWTTEAKRDTKRMSAKEVTINVTDSIRQMDRSKRITKNCVN
uniref:brain and acute leukemia cytoplasmic protein isoform X2 n=1 Tax=Ictidomys tridecemlineatus TaxID=43179 RepID=UPI000B539721|nr:brain and acute leukemia cytoplasmic protein isoform X2 [Ictidomys tridecemlineatus]